MMGDRKGKIVRMSKGSRGSDMHLIGGGGCEEELRENKRTH